MPSAPRGSTGRFDLIVVGAGPAGSAAAACAARAGLSVALVDRASFPRNKLCGGGFTGRALQAYRRAFDREVLTAPHLTATEIRFGAFGREIGRFSDVPPLYMTMRESLDLALFEAAEAAGVQSFTGRRPDHIDPEAPAVQIGSARLEAPLMIGADGVSSAVARALFGRPFDPARIGFALEIEWPGTLEEPDVRIDFGAADWGYGWVFPKHGGTTIGVGGVHARNPDMKARLAAYLAALDLPGTARVQGQYLPFGAPRPVPGRGAVLLAGDAAGLVDPITGEGIAYALESGRHAAEAARDALAAGAPESALVRYRQGLGPIHGAMRHARLIRPILFHPHLREGFIASFRRSATLKHDYLRLLAGETEYAGISAKLARRLPRHLWSALTLSRGDRQEFATRAP